MATVLELIDRVLQSAASLRAEGRVPFSWLAGSVQALGRCWLSLADSDKYGYPALCLTKIVRFHYIGDREEFFLPHHLIIADTGHSDLVRRLGVAHEIGHVLMHFPRYSDAIVAGTFAPSLIGSEGQISYSPEEEVEANVFAGMLNLSAPPSTGQPLSLEAVRQGLVDSARSYHVDESRIDQIVAGLEAGYERIRDREPD